MWDILRVTHNFSMKSLLYHPPDLGAMNWSYQYTSKIPTTLGQTIKPFIIYKQPYLYN